MSDQFEQPEQNLMPEGREQSNTELAERHRDLCRETKQLIDEESRLVAEAAEGPINMDSLKAIHIRQSDIVAEQWQIEQELGKRLAG